MTTFQNYSLCDNDRTCSAGSDDGRVYIWDARSGALVCALEADEDIVNSVAAHPSLPYLATSGIEDKVRIWGPRSSPVHQYLSEQIQRNQVGFTSSIAYMQSLAVHYIEIYNGTPACGACCTTGNAAEDDTDSHESRQDMTKKECSASMSAVHVQESIQNGPRTRSLLLHPGILQAITGTHPDLLQGLLGGEAEIHLGPGMPDRPGGCVIC